MKDRTYGSDAAGSERGEERCTVSGSQADGTLKKKNTHRSEQHDGDVPQMLVFADRLRLSAESIHTQIKKQITSQRPDQRTEWKRTTLKESTTMVSMCGHEPLSATSIASCTTYGRSPSS